MSNNRVDFTINIGGNAYRGVADFTDKVEGLNVVLTANPIELIVAAVAVLAGVIVYLVSHINGWRTAWRYASPMRSSRWNNRKK